MIGFGYPANMIGQISITETTVGKYSGLYLCCLFSFYGLSCLLIWPITNFTNDWHEIMMYFIMIPHLVVNIVSIFSYESP